MTLVPSIETSYKYTFKDSSKKEDKEKWGKKTIWKSRYIKRKKSRLNELNKLLNIGENTKTNTWKKRKIRIKYSRLKDRWYGAKLWW